MANFTQINNQMGAPRLYVQRKNKTRERIRREEKIEDDMMGVFKERSLHPFGIFFCNNHHVGVNKNLTIPNTLEVKL